MPKLDTSVKTPALGEITSKRIADSEPSSVFNEDIMLALRDFKNEFRTSNKSIQDELKRVSNQMNVLMAENAQLRSEVEVLKVKI